MKRHILTSLSLAALLITACGGKEDSPEKRQEKSRLEKAAWLLGSWKNSSDQGTMTETWTKDNADSYSAKTYFVIGKDTVFRELSRLEETGSNLQCVISIEGENDEKPVTFVMTKQSEQNLVFENPKHDFPNKITYQQKGDSVIAEISGMQKGKIEKERFAMVRVK
ncbi:DUF6265 family protein [uncultured Fluviicola sp.]|uniref:DUF6265 family protein n=1 Tax=uncultured Fluviicola sp. TaxID=463303 RepID=UPI0025FC66FD|nr:DUF6265 family protein [uncultured Fluviicola sp.]